MTKLLLKMKRTTHGRALIFYLAASLFILGSLPNIADAAPVRTDEAMSVEFDRGEAIAQIMAVLDRKDVQSQLVEMGYSADEIKSRLDTLSDFELQQVQAKAQQLDHGGDSALGVIIALLVIALLVLLIWYIWKKSQ